MQGLQNANHRPDDGLPPEVPAAGPPGPAMAGRADVRWKRALKGVTAAAFRLHYYRFVRTRMLHDALSASRDVCGPGDSPAEVRPEIGR